MPLKSGLHHSIAAILTWKEFKGVLRDGFYKSRKVLYKDILELLNILPLAYDKKIKDLTFFFK